MLFDALHYLSVADTLFLPFVTIRYYLSLIVIIFIKIRGVTLQVNESSIVQPEGFCSVVQSRKLSKRPHMLKRNDNLSIVEFHRLYLGNYFRSFFE